MPQSGLKLNDGTELDPKVLSVVKAIKNTESGGSKDPYNATGDDGDAKGAFQYNEKTGPGWKNLAKEFLGNENAIMDKSNQNKVTYYRVKKMKDEGKQPEEIAALWNGAVKNGDGTFTYKNPDYGVKFRQNLDKEIAMMQGSQAGAPEPGALQQLGQDLSGRASQFGHAFTDTLHGETNVGETALRAAGAIGGGVNDVIGAGINAVLPQQAKDAVGGLASRVVSNPQVQKSMQSYHDEVSPRARENIAAGANVVSALIPLKGAQAAKAPLAAGAARAGRAALNTARPAAAREAAMDIASQKSTLGTITKGLKSGKPDPRTVNSAKEIEDLVRDGSLRTGDSPEAATHNSHVLRSEIKKSADEVVRQLDADEIPLLVDAKDLEGLKQSAIKAAKGKSASVSIAKSAEENVNYYFDKFMEYLPKDKDILAKDVLKARQQFDNWIEDARGEGVFDPATDNAITASTRAMRQGANELFFSKAPNVAAREAFKRQTNLYNVLDNVAKKGASGIKEADKVAKMPGLRGLITRHPIKAGAAATVLGGAAANMGIPSFLNPFD